MDKGGAKSERGYPGPTRGLRCSSARSKQTDKRQDLMTQAETAAALPKVSRLKAISVITDNIITMIHIYQIILCSSETLSKELPPLISETTKNSVIKVIPHVRA